MSSKYQYKQTGLDWIGDMPTHWNLISLKNAFYVIPSNVDKRSEDDEIEVQLCNYVDVYYNDYINLSIDFMTATATDAEIKRFQLEVGDVLITKDSEDPFDIAVPAYVAQIKDKLLCGYHLSLLRSSNKKVNGSYLFWTLKDEVMATQLWREATGVTRWAIASRHIKNSIIPLPSYEEQNAIANYLNKACADINKVIELKSQQIANANERCKSLVAEIVTRGLNKNANLIDCRIPWLPKMPETWSVTRLKSIADLRSGDGITSERISEDGVFPVYGGNGLRGYTESFTHEGEFVLIGRQGALCGNINYAFGKFFASEHAVVLTPIMKYDTFWLGELLRYMNLNQYSNAAAQPGLSVEKIKNLHIPLPKYEEQVLLSAEINKVIECTQLLVENINQQITKLEEFKKAIIHEVVTGKKQVYFEVEKIKRKSKAELNAVA